MGLPYTAHQFPNPYTKPSPQVPVSYRTSLTSADVISVPGTVTCTKQAGGSCGAGTYYVKVVACNAYGRTTAKAGNTTITTETTNLTVRAAFAAVTGATHYDIYCSTDAHPLWVGRITAVQRASGIKITAVGTTGAGGTAGAVDAEVVGTGLAAGTTAAVSTAYSLPASTIDCTGYDYISVDVLASRTGDAVAPALVLTPFFYDSVAGTYFSGTGTTVTFGGTAGNYGSLKQRVRIQVRGNSAVALCVESIAGTGMSVDLYYGERQFAATGWWFMGSSNVQRPTVNAKRSTPARMQAEWEGGEGRTANNRRTNDERNTAVHRSG